MNFLIKFLVKIGGLCNEISLKQRGYLFKEAVNQL